MHVLDRLYGRPAGAAVRAQWVSLWTGPPAAVILLVAALAFPGFRPPMSPNLSAAAVAAFYAEHTAGIRFSQVTFNLCGILVLPFFMVIVVQMKRMQNQSQALAYAYLTAVVSGATIFALSNIFFLVAAFRPERDPDLIMLLNDLAWIVLIAPIGMVVSQFVLLATAVYLDDPADPVFPRWVGHLSILTAVAMIPAAGAAVFRSGPLAWDGVLSFWVRNGAFVAFLVVMFFVLRRTILREATDLESAAG
ncbi:hypothetical protein [Skermania piniformis]|uniref:DUF4386 family protein n=1 Tax=Skermania pinensis TaxID=39122 RepID=A0ABX8SBU4_9ACTN|nr:hypothetical protein [Skermania piniformis]QXQ13171.1 hypothetical protein KV203_14965 [Skermania piniformis]